MSRTAVLALVLVAASASTAAAGPYLGLGIGTGAASSGDINFEENGRSFRVMGGYRFANFGVEGLGTWYDLREGYDFDVTTLAVAARYNFVLGDRFEAFPRLGLQRTSITRGDNLQTAELAGNGFLIGGGFEYRFPLVAAGASIFVDYTILRTNLKNIHEQEIPLTSRIWTLGATISF